MKKASTVDEDHVLSCDGSGLQKLAPPANAAPDVRKAFKNHNIAAGLRKRALPRWEAEKKRIIGHVLSCAGCPDRFPVPRYLRPLLTEEERSMVGSHNSKAAWQRPDTVERHKPKEKLPALVNSVTHADQCGGQCGKPIYLPHTNCKYILPGERAAIIRHNKQVRSFSESSNEYLVRLVLGRPHHDFYLWGYRWDVVYKEQRLLIEVDGCTFHSCEVCNLPGWKSHLINDARKGEIAKRKGWRLVRLPEHEIPKFCVAPEKWLRRNKIAVVPSFRIAEELPHKTSVADTNRWIIRTAKNYGWRID